MCTELLRIRKRVSASKTDFFGDLADPNSGFSLDSIMLGLMVVGFSPDGLFGVADAENVF